MGITGIMPRLDFFCRNRQMYRAPRCAARFLEQLQRTPQTLRSSAFLSLRRQVYLVPLVYLACESFSWSTSISDDDSVSMPHGPTKKVAAHLANLKRTDLCARANNASEIQMQSLC
ncbi:hypothetical protein BD309DRAFT_290655 [Dichomitus squalens]|uniref:Uncharacterized protein n=1 Tax=Dichomitus squalens TaxID=114155 RepID=A0A4Q9PQA4_9APHY|nr:hypothetical protein BD309DRAFT_290655 [Dichomitus squalens]TBU56527.1 hypothetical protein BD310DRAFT_931365 [Dichomitus squalens]